MHNALLCNATCTLQRAFAVQQLLHCTGLISNPHMTLIQPHTCASRCTNLSEQPELQLPTCWSGSSFWHVTSHFSVAM